MSRTLKLLAVGAVLLLIPQLSHAAPGSFTSSSYATPAVKAVQTDGNGAKAVEARTTHETAYTYAVSGVAESSLGVGVSGIGGRYGVYGHSGQTVDSVGVFGSGIKYGVYGTSAGSTASVAGVYGKGTVYGMLAESTGSSGRALYAHDLALSGTTYGVVGRTENTSGRGVFGWARATSGTTYGVIGDSDSPQGIGVFADGGMYGLLAETAGIGDGTYGVLSASDLATRGHLVAQGENVAGTCTVTVGTAAKKCAFAAPFAAGTVPIVVVTPRGANPGTAYWITDPTTSSFTLRLAATQGTARTFNFIVVGVLSSL